MLIIFRLRLPILHYIDKIPLRLDSKSSAYVDSN
jgi:hypothetical protein